jgi:hypothetical protein
VLLGILAGRSGLGSEAVKGTPDGVGDGAGLTVQGGGTLDAYPQPGHAVTSFGKKLSQHPTPKLAPPACPHPGVDVAELVKSGVAPE